MYICIFIGQKMENATEKCQHLLKLQNVSTKYSVFCLKYKFRLSSALYIELKN